MIEIKNAKYVSASTNLVDVEINHPDHGWLPYTFIEDEVDDSYDEEIREYLLSANITPFVVNAAEVASQQLASANRQARIYLDSTDWYVIRQLETGAPVPAAISTARAEARVNVTEG